MTVVTIESGSEGQLTFCLDHALGIVGRAIRFNKRPV